MKQTITIDQLFRALCEENIEFAKQIGPEYSKFILPYVRELALYQTELLFNKALSFKPDGQ